MRVRPKMKWADVTYTLWMKDGTNIKYKNGTACFSSMRRKKNVDYISIYRTKCKETLSYHDAYLKYIGDMFHLEYTLGKNSFKFKAFNCGKKNMLVSSMIRVLFEPLCSRYPHDVETFNINEAFLEPLLINGKCPYKDKLKRFCYFYSKINLPGSYHTDLHMPLPYKVRMKSYKQFNNIEKFSNGVNKFFYKKKYDK